MINQKKTNQQGSKKQDPKKKPDQFDWTRAGKTSLVWIMIIFGAIYISGLMTQTGKKRN